MTFRPSYALLSLTVSLTGTVIWSADPHAMLPPGCSARQMLIGLAQAGKGSRIPSLVWMFDCHLAQPLPPAASPSGQAHMRCASASRTGSVVVVGNDAQSHRILACKAH